MKEYRQRKQASESVQTPIQSPQCKQKNKQYMKEYRQRKRASDVFRHQYRVLSLSKRENSI